MDQSQNDLVKQVFQEALERPGSERVSFVDAACEGDSEARDRVVALLGAYDDADGFLASPTLPPEAVRGAGVGVNGSGGFVGTRIGPYKLLQVIGEGGFGVVYMAEQEEPIRRRVALKLVKLGMDTKEVIARFEAERQALAMMEHPNIARVLDAGATETGRPYFVMELVRGVPITEYCDENCLSTRERLELFAQVCHAVQHAHQKGIVHRDLKPSNVMVTLHDGRAMPKVIDFGVARAISHPLTDRTLFTEFGQFIGTPTYMSPEQAEMSGLDIDTRSDIYSLGVLLYELLTGTTPYTRGQLKHVARLEILRVLREVEPPRPSTRLSQMGESSVAVARLRGSEPSALEKLLRGDLDWIVMKALEKDRGRRYASASELAADLERYFGGDPVSAGPPDLGYRLRKIVRKHRGKVAAAAAVVLAILAGGSTATWQALRAGAAAEQAQANATYAYAASSDDPLLKALLVSELADGPDLPGKLALLRDAANAPLPTWVIQGPDFTNNTWYSPDGELLASAFMDGTVRIWRTDRTGDPVILDHGYEVDGIAFSPDSRRIVTGTSDGVVRVWSVDGGEPVVLQADLRIESVDFSPDGTLVSAGTEQGGPIWIWSADGTGEPVRIDWDRPMVGGHFFPDGERILTGGRDVAVWGTDGSGPLAVFPADPGGWAYAVPSPDGSMVAAGRLGRAHVHTVDGSAPPLIVEHPGAIRWANRFDGRHVATAAHDDATVKLWPLERPGEPVTLELPEGPVLVQLARDGYRAYTSSGDGAIRVWRRDGTLEATLPGPGRGGISESPDGTRIIGDYTDGTLREWAVDGRYGEAIVLEHPAPVRGVEYSPDGRLIATAGDDGAVRVWSAEGAGGAIVLGAETDAATSVRFSPDGRRLIAGYRDGTARIWPTDGAGAPVVLSHGAPVYDAAFGPDGERVVTGGGDGRVLLWPGDGSGDAVLVTTHLERIRSVSFSPDGESVMSSSETARVTPLEDGGDGGDGDGGADRESEGQPDPMRGSYFVADAEFSPDGRMVAAGSEGGDLRLFTVGSDADPILLPGEETDVRTVAFSEEGDRVAGGAEDGSVWVWPLAGEESPIELTGHRGPVTGVSFAPDGKRVVTASLDGTVRIWRVTWDELLEYVRANLRACLTVEQRVRYLAEDESEAEAKWGACQEGLAGS